MKNSNENVITNDNANGKAETKQSGWDAIRKHLEAEESVSNYFRMPEPGKYHIQLMSDFPVICKTLWEGNQPTHFRQNEVPKNVIEKNLKPMWATLVYNVDEKCCQLWTISQKHVIEQILQLLTEEGEINSFDIIIRRTGSEKNDTRYTLTPLKPATVIPNVIKDKASEIDLDQLFVPGGNPFNPNQQNSLPWEAK